MEDLPSSFVKQLAANDRPSRDKAIHSLRTYLSAPRDLPPLELLKLWKGLFYCLWMSDRPRTQHALCNSLAELVFVVPAQTTIPFLRAFWQTMQREWTNIDVLRMEKFLLLVRRYLGATFEVLKLGKWEKVRVIEMMELLSEVPCNVLDLRVPNGLRYHVIDVYVDELERVEVLGGEHAQFPLEDLLWPLRDLRQRSPTKTVRLKAREALRDERLPGKESTQEVESAQEQTVVKSDGPVDLEEENWSGIED